MIKPLLGILYFIVGIYIIIFLAPKGVWTLLLIALLVWPLPYFFQGYKNLKLGRVSPLPISRQILLLLGVITVSILVVLAIAIPILQKVTGERTLTLHGPENSASINEEYKTKIIGLKGSTVADPAGKQQALDLIGIVQDVGFEKGTTLHVSTLLSERGERLYSTLLSIAKTQGIEAQVIEYSGTNYLVLNLIIQSDAQDYKVFLPSPNEKLKAELNRYQPSEINIKSTATLNSESEWLIKLPLMNSEEFEETRREAFGE